MSKPAVPQRSSSAAGHGVHSAGASLAPEHGDGVAAADADKAMESTARPEASREAGPSMRSHTRSISTSSSAGSLRARASARGGVSIISTPGPPHLGADSKAVSRAAEQRIVNAQRGTARPAAFTHESPRLRRVGSTSSQLSHRRGGAPSPFRSSGDAGGAGSSSSSMNDFHHTHGPPARSRGGGGGSGGGGSAGTRTGTHSSSHSPLINEALSESSHTGSYRSSRADTLDLPFDVVSAGSQSPWAMNAVMRRARGGSDVSASPAIARIGRAYPQTKVLPFGEQLRILVTGGAGFVGSHLVDRLMMEGHEVLVMDNFFTGSKMNLSTWTGHPNFELLRHDVVNPLLVEVDQIYHLACPASPKDYQRNEVKTLKTCFQGTLNMLGLAKRTRARFLLASTSEVYGDPQVHPQREDYAGHVHTTGWRSCYDEGKRVAETLTYAYHQDGVDVRVARIFNTYGPNLSPQDGRVVSTLLLQALKGEALSVFGDGRQTRSFMYISDLVDGLIALMNREPTGLALNRQAAGADSVATASATATAVDVHSPVNLGNPNEFTMLELVQVVQDVVRELRRRRRGPRRGRAGSGLEGVERAALPTGLQSGTADALADRLQALKTSAAAAAAGASRRPVGPSTGSSSSQAARSEMTPSTMKVPLAAAATAAAETETDTTPLVQPAAGPASPDERLDLAADSMLPSLGGASSRLGLEQPPDAAGEEDVDEDGEEDDEDEPPLAIEFRPLPLDDPKMRCPEITRARALLGWEPRWSLYDGLMETALYFQALLDDGLI